MSPSRKRVTVVVVVVAALLLLLAAWVVRPADRSVAVGSGAASAPGAAADPVADAGSRAGRPTDRRVTRAPGRGVPAPFQGFERRLDNGLTLIVVPDPTEPVVATRVVVRVGSLDDPPGAEGASHLLEHLLFAGTDRLGTADWRAEAPHIDALRGWYDTRTRAAADERAAIDAEIAAEHAAADGPALPGEVRRLLAALGARGVNAATTRYSTTFVANVPSNHLAQWARVEAERLTQPVLRGMPIEVDVVIDEIRLRRTHLGGEHAAAVDRALFGDHRYAAGIGGTPTSVAGIPMSALEAHWEKFYVPGNLAVVLVGDVDPVEAERIVSDTFGALPALPVPARRPVPPPPPPRAVAVAQDGQVEVTWSFYGLDASEVAALRVGLAALDDGLPTGVLAPSASITLFPGGGKASFRAYCVTDDPCDVALRTALDTLLREPIDEGFVAGARAGCAMAQLQAVEDPSVQADIVADAYARGEVLESASRAYDALLTVTAAQVHDVVHRVLATPWIAPVPSPDAPPPPIPSASSDLDDPRRSRLYDAILAMPVTPIAPRWWVEGVEYTTARDGRVIAAHNPKNGLFGLVLTWPGGVRDDPVRCEAVSRWWEAGRADGWGRTLRRHMVLPARQTCTDAEARIAIAGFEFGAAPAMEALFAAMRSPVFERRRPGRRWSRTDRDAAARAFVLIGAASPYRDAWPAPAQRGVDDAVARASLRRMAAVAPLVDWVGQRDAEQVAALVGEGAPPTGPEAPRPDRPARDRVFESHDGASQVTVTRWGEPYDPEREALYTVYEHYIGGGTGVAQERLRESLGRAYGMRGRLVRGARPGEANRTEIEVWARADRAVTVAAEAVAVLRSSVVPADRFDRVWDAVDVATAEGVRGFREGPAEIRAWLGHGLFVDVQEHVWSRLEAVDHATFAAFVDAESRRPITVLVQAALDAEGRAALARVGDVTVLTDADLFGGR